MEVRVSMVEIEMEELKVAIWNDASFKQCITRVTRRVTWWILDAGGGVARIGGIGQQRVDSDHQEGETGTD